MDDFFAEMKPILDEVQHNRNRVESQNSHGLLPNRMPSMFDSLIP